MKFENHQKCYKIDVYCITTNLRFWYHVFTWVSDKFKASATSLRSATDKYFWHRNLRSKYASCEWVKAVRRRRGFRPIFRAWNPLFSSLLLLVVPSINRTWNWSVELACTDDNCDWYSLNSDSDDECSSMSTLTFSSLSSQVESEFEKCFH